MEKRTGLNSEINDLEKAVWSNPVLKKYPRILTECGSKPGEENIGGNVGGTNSNPGGGTQEVEGEAECTAAGF